MVTTAKAKAPSDTSHWLTRRQASDLLGVAEGTLSRWERLGFLHPQYARRGQSVREVTIYDPDELVRVPQRHKRPLPNAAGEQAAIAFQLFDEGKSIREVVIEIRETPRLVTDLYEQWLDAGGVPPAARGVAQVAPAPLAAVEAEAKVAIEVDLPAVAEGGPSDEQIETAIGNALDAAGAP